MKGYSELVLKCPDCGREDTVQAHMVHLESCTTNVLMGDKGNDTCLDWDNVEVSGDFEYICPWCEYRYAMDREELLKIAKDQERGLIWKKE